MLPAPVVIGRSIALAWFVDSHLKPSYLTIGTTITIEHNVRYRCKKVLRLGGGNSPNSASLLSWTLRAMALMLSPILLGSGITN